MDTTAAADATLTISPQESGSRSSLPAPLRTLNGLFTAWDRLTHRTAFALTEGIVLKAVRKKTKVSDVDFGDILAPLRLLCAMTKDPPSMTPLGRLSMRTEIIQRVCNKVLIDDTVKADPGILSERIEQPWFVLGMPRTGTTLLHRLLARDPEHRAPLAWETGAPCPPPDPSVARDPRLQSLRTALRFLDYVAHSFKAIHGIGADLPEECLGLMANVVMSESFAISRMGAYCEWFERQDLTKTYEAHKLQLQILQRKFPRQRWVLKSPAHLRGLKWLLKVYPDARIIQLHRDPSEALASYASLVTSARGMNYEHLDLRAIGRELFDRMESVLREGAAARAEETSRPQSRARFVDVRYPAFVKDPVGAAARIYAEFGCELSDAAKQRMKDYLDSNRQHKYGRHRYSLEQFGIDPAAARERFAWYSNRFLADDAS